MGNVTKDIGVALCGLATSLLVAVADIVIARTTTIDFFTFSVWVVVPAGAMLVGFAAASGYYFGSLFFNKRPTIMLLLQMVVIAGATQLLIYYLGYYTFVLDDGRHVADYISFLQYLDVSLKSAHYRIGPSLATDTGEAGSLGYWIAAIQFIGFLVGGLAVYAYLRLKIVCPTCNLYLRTLAKKQKTFEDIAAASSYYDVIFTHEVAVRNSAG